MYQQQSALHVVKSVQKLVEMRGVVEVLLTVDVGDNSAQQKAASISHSPITVFSETDFNKPIAEHPASKHRLEGFESEPGDRIDENKPSCNSWVTQKTVYICHNWAPKTFSLAHVTPFIFLLIHFAIFI